MKFLLSLTCLFCITANAQWSDNTNLFYDSLNMKVCTAANDQTNPIVVRSYPDKGYFVIWLDKRNDPNKFDIYAQKYSSAGKALWTDNGKPVITGNGSQYFGLFSNVDLRYNSYACTDSANGFYIAWEDENVASGSTVKHKVMAQHVLSNGSRVFTNGYKIAAPASDEIINYGSVQLIADGNKGFFVGYLKTGQYGDVDLYVSCYRDENGTMKNYGGGRMNVNGYNQAINTACGIGNNIVTPEVQVLDYQIYSDRQEGCNIVMNLDAHTGGNESQVIGFNRLCRVKKNCSAKQYRRSSDIAVDSPYITKYKKDDVVQLYNYTTFYNTVTCRDQQGNIYVVTNYYVENLGNGYLTVTDPSYTSTAAQGVTIPTGDNININFIATNERRYLNNTVGNYYTKGYYLQQEIYDSIPYQLCSSNVAYVAYNTTIPGKYAKLTNFTDTIISQQSVYTYNFHLATSGNEVAIAGTTYGNPNPTVIQQFKVVNTDTKKYTVKYATGSQKGIVIGKDANTGFGGTNMGFSNSFLAGDDNGNIFYAVDEYTHYTRVSPLGDSAKLKWGAMGRPINKIGYTSSPYVVVDPTNGTGVIAWYSYNNATGTNDIFIRHLNSLNTDNKPAIKKILQKPNFSNYNYPAVMVGSSKTSTMVEGNDINGNLTPIYEITDNANLGIIQSGMYEQPSVYDIRKYNNQPYLNRNFTILPEKTTNALLNVRFYISNTDFNNLKAADPTITSPSQLMAVQQPNAGPNANPPDTYAPITGQQTLTATSSGSVSGGYYVVFKTKKFGNFFLFKNGAVVNSLVAETKSLNTEGFIKTVNPTIIDGNVIMIETGNKNVTRMNVEIYNTSGQLIFKREGLNYASQQLPLNITMHGDYQLRITSGENIFTTKLFKP